MNHRIFIIFGHITSSFIIMANRISTLDEFIIEREKKFPYSTGEFSQLLNSIKLASKIVNHQISRAGLVDIIGKAGNTNIQGEEQKKLDVFANETFKQALISLNIVCGILSEEETDFLSIGGLDNDHQNKYLLSMDPLDGSSNIDVSVSVGTIFSILRRKSPTGSPVNKEDFLQPGKDQVAAGYIIYGTSTMLVLSMGNGVNGFTLNPAIGTFYLSHPNMTFPEMGHIYSTNEGYYRDFPLGIKKYIKYCQTEEEDRPYTSRYIGSLVSDFHRNLIQGGIYIYPQSTKYKNGKLRLQYEANPLAFLCEQAKGKASDGSRRILDINPKELHQRIPFICGSPRMVEKVEAFLKAY